MMPQVGEVIEFLYPKKNHFGTRAVLRKRRVKVEAVRDLTEEPLELADIVRRPLVRRGMVLVTGIDQEKKERRSFYLDWSRGVRFQTSLPGRRPIRTGLSKVEMECFADICQQLLDPGGVVEVLLESAA